ncbi:MAG: AbrB/MazE/SpoVT family DNA-binding domain-containing protein [Candidatus Nanoarchaeia archaeon]
MTTTATIKTWGSSLGVVLPRELVKEQHLKEGEEIVITVHKKKNINELFGKLKHWKINTQKLKDDLRKEEEE